MLVKPTRHSTIVSTWLLSAALLLGATGQAQTSPTCSALSAPGPTAPSGAYLPATSEATYPNLLASPARKPSVAGALQLVKQSCTLTLADAQGQPIQLRGMSTHGLQWFPEVINAHAFAALTQDWGANVVRLSMYVGEGGYATNPAVKQKVLQGIEEAIAHDLYVIVDWHVHAPGDPNADVYQGALAFFSEISRKYPNDKHLIYELANEPNPGNAPGISNDAAGWARVKAYAEPIIKMLRAAGNHNIVIVGNPNWSQRPDLAADNPIQDPATMYTVHFYTGTHQPSADDSDRSNVMSNARYALEHGAAVISTEWGTSEASGNNGPFLQAADTWLDFLNRNNISWVNWSLTNKNETSAALTAFQMNQTAATSFDPGPDQIWAPAELTVSGEFVRNRIQGKAYKPFDRTAFSSTVWDFETGGVQGWALNADSPIKAMTLSSEQGALKLQGLKASQDVSSDNFWANVRLSANDSVARPDANGAAALTLDVIVPAATDTAVAVAAVPQSATHGWTNPARAAQVTAEQFTRQPDGRYKATLTLTLADAPNLKVMAEDPEKPGSTLTNLVLFIGAKNTDTLWLDNIAVSGHRSTSLAAVQHAPLGKLTLPTTFEDATRQSWAWDDASGVKTRLTLGDVDSSKALGWDVAYPEVKPTDTWASAPRLVLDLPGQTRGDNNFLLFDFYLNPLAGHGNQGALSLNVAFGPPSLGYWAQAQDTVTIPLDQLARLPKTASGLYHVQGKFDLRKLTDNKVLAPDTPLGKLTLIIADVQSNFAGSMFLDNVRFTPTAP